MMVETKEELRDIIEYLRCQLLMLQIENQQYKARIQECNVLLNQPLPRINLATGET
jgi:hypothetical protein